MSWVPSITYTSTCEINMKSFPFDQQNCTFDFASWVYDDTKMYVDLLDDYSKVDLESFVNSSEWSIVTTGANKIVKSDGSLLFTSLEYYIVIQRQPGFYVYVLIVPSLLLSALTPALFWIPPSRPDRTTLAMSLFSSYFVMLLVLVQLFPTSASESRLAIYYCFSMTLIATSTLLSTLVIYISNKSHRQPVPQLFNKILIQFVGKLLRVTSSKVTCIEDNVVQKQNAVMTSSAARSTGPDNRKTITIATSQVNHSSKTKDSSDHEQLGSTFQADWKVIVIVLDRIFFVVSTLATAVAIAALFPRN